MGKIKCLNLKDVSIFSEIDIDQVLLNQGEKINRIYFIGGNVK